MADATISEGAPYGRVYCITNTQTGKCYVGITRHQVPKRWLEHRKMCRSKRAGALYDAIRKYGSAVFAVEEIGEAADRPSLLLMEQRFIIELNTRAPNGYNLTDGGDGSHGCKPSESATRKRSASLRHSWAAPGFREEVSQTQLNAWANNPERRHAAADRLRSEAGEHMRSRLPARPSAETQSKISASIKTYWKSDGARERQSAISKQQWADTENRNDRINRAAAKQRTTEGRTLAAARAKALWADPDFRAKMMLARKK